MKRFNKKIIFIILCFSALAIGLGSGALWHHYKNTKTVVFRISVPQNKIDYDLSVGIKYLQYQFEQNGYQVLPWRYPGAFYHQKGDNAAVNVFVRANNFFYDTRMNPKAFNVFYLHRFFNMFREELRGYDYYLSSQKSLGKAFPKRDHLGYFASGAIPHKRLKPNYKYDILYINEYQNSDYIDFIRENYHVQQFNSLKFAQLPEKERLEKFAQSRLVVYDVALTRYDDKDYAPYAAYDIASYGRPLMTKYNAPLYQITGNNIYYFAGGRDMINLTRRALAESDKNREEKAQRARKDILEASKKVKLELPIIHQ